MPNYSLKELLMATSFGRKGNKEIPGSTAGPEITPTWRVICVMRLSQKGVFKAMLRLLCPLQNTQTNKQTNKKLPILFP